MAAMASMAMLPFALLVLLQLFAAVRAADNGLGLTPPMGWRNWNFYQGEITQEIMEANMHAMVDKSRTPLGHSEPASLLELGYTHAGLDDNWQACGAGVGGSFHAADGTPLINTSRFPSMKSMVATGHRLGLKVGWYDNNCICGEGSARLNATQVAKDVEGNVKYIAEMQFDGLKADGCGPGRDLPTLAALLNASGRPVLIENCHYFKWPNSSLPAGVGPDRVNRVWPYWKDNVTGGDLICPENLFRASGDISNSWGSWFGNLASLSKYQDEQHPISRPGCWAYADMLMVGVFANSAAPRAGPPHSFEEWRSHFGAWCINSSPLVLSFNLTNATTMDQVWPFISNTNAIAVNQDWAGHPGREVSITNSSSSSSSRSGPKVWTKPLSGGRQAVLVVNMGGAATLTEIELDMAVIAPKLACASGAAGCVVSDVWRNKTAGTTTGGSSYKVSPGLASHDSEFLIFG